MATTIVNQKPTEVTPTFLQWSQDETGTPCLVWEPALICPECGDPCGYLFANGCLSCHLDAEERAAAAITAYEASEADAVWGKAEMSCSTCGID